MDQRISTGSAGSLAAVWVGRDLIGAAADRGHHGESQHDKRDVAIPSMPEAGLVMIKAQLIFCRLEAVLDGPAAALHTHQFLDRGSCWSPGGERGQLVSGMARRIKRPRVQSPERLAT